MILRVRRTLDEGLTLIFEWQGGPYIDVRSSALRVPSEVINVWDYAKGERVIPFDRESLTAHVDQWITEYPRDDLIRDVVDNWKWGQ